MCGICFVRVWGLIWLFKGLLLETWDGAGQLVVFGGTSKDTKKGRAMS